MAERMWMVRAGEGGYLSAEFEKGYVAIGWNDLGDLTDIKSQEDIKALYRRVYPGERPGQISAGAAMVNKFRGVITKGDKIASYDPSKREYLVGSVESDYHYNPGEIRDYNHLRRVRWIGRVSRDALSPSSRNSLGSIQALFELSEDVAKELMANISGQPTLLREEESHEEKVELGQIKEDTIARAHELIKDKLLDLADDEMEQMTAAILRAMGYKPKVMPKGPDRGVDVLASPDGLGLEEPRIKVEVKHRSKTQIGAQEVRSFLGGLRDGDRALYVSTGGFSKEAKYEADRAKHPITLVDLNDLAILIVNHYENFDVEGRVLMPLVRIYWPAE